MLIRSAFQLPVTRRSMLALASAALLALAGRRSAAATTDLDLRYTVAMLDTQIAQVSLSVVRDGASVATSLVIHNTGIAAFLGGDGFTKMTATSTLGPYGLLPVVFDTLEQEPDRVRKIQIHYNKKGNIDSLTYRNNGRLKNSDVPTGLQEGTIDPLTALLRLRAWLSRIAVGETTKEVTLPIFDGRKRFDLDAVYLGRTIYADWHVQELKVQLIARYSFSQSSRSTTSPDEPNPPWIPVLVSDDERRMPIHLEIVNGLLTSVVTLAGDCARNGTGCAPRAP